MISWFKVGNSWIRPDHVIGWDDIEEVTREEAPKLYRVKVMTTAGAKTTDFDSRGAAEEYVKLLEEIEWRPWVDREIFVCIEDPREK